VKIGSKNDVCMHLNKIPFWLMSAVLDCKVAKRCACTIAYYTHCQYSPYSAFGAEGHAPPIAFAKGGNVKLKDDLSDFVNSLEEDAAVKKNCPTDEYCPCDEEFGMEEEYSKPYKTATKKFNKQGYHFWCCGEKASDVECFYRNDDEPPPPPASGDGAGGEPCFSGDTQVETENGITNLRSLRQESNPVAVKVLDSQNRVTFAPVIGWLHSEEVEGTYIQVQAGGRKLAITDDHLIYTVPCQGGQREAKFAKDLSAGECLLVEQEGLTGPRPIETLERVAGQGYYAPVTTEGTLVVNGIAASCYANTKHEAMAHFAFQGLFSFDKLMRSGGRLHDGAPSCLAVTESF
jgi:hypothetical protein